jgi:superfamily I DNA/RNA helicase
MLVMFFADNIPAQKQEKIGYDRKKPKELIAIIDSLNNLADSLNRMDSLNCLKIGNMSGEIDSLSRVADNLEKEMGDLRVDKYLNREDTTVFTDFQDFSNKKIHPSRRDHYLLIENIHALASLLQNITELGKELKLNEAKQKLDEASEKIAEINSYATDEKHKIANYLSEPQKQYYRNMVNRYNNLYRIFYPTSE